MTAGTKRRKPKGRDRLRPVRQGPIFDADDTEVVPPGAATLGEWVARAERAYQTYGATLGQVAASAHDEALYLLLRTLGLPLDSPASVLRRKLTPAQQKKLTEVLRRRLVDHVPAAYLTREAWLGDLRFHVDERVIIPRSYFVELLPQIAEMLEGVGGARTQTRQREQLRTRGGVGDQAPHRKAGRIRRQQPVTRVVDVCTGSGCLAVLLARRFPRAKVDAIELSPDAAAVARFNLAGHRLADRVKLWRSDVFDAVPVARYDLILSNPPYVPTRELRGLPEEFKREPVMALDGGRDGLDVIRKLLRQARDRLQPHGMVALEVGGLRPAMGRAFPELDLQWLHTADGEDCVCVIQAGRLAGWEG